MIFTWQRTIVLESGENSYVKMIKWSIMFIKLGYRRLLKYFLNNLTCSLFVVSWGYQKLNTHISFLSSFKIFVISLLIEYSKLITWSKSNFEVQFYFHSKRSVEYSKVMWYFFSVIIQKLKIWVHNFITLSRFSVWLELILRLELLF